MKSFCNEAQCAVQKLVVNTVINKEMLFSNVHGKSKEMTIKNISVKYSLKWYLFSSTFN